MTPEERANEIAKEYRSAAGWGDGWGDADRHAERQIREAEKAIWEEAARYVESMWTPSVGGYPSGPELAEGLRKRAR